MKIKQSENNDVKKDFECGNESLDNYIRRIAKQDVKRDLSACYVLVSEGNVVKGYYTLSASSIKREDFPEQSKIKLPPSYEAYPSILLGRLAVDKSEQKKGFGEVLLLDALKRCADISDQLGCIAVTVDPIDEGAIKFYESYGFIMLPDVGRMMLAMQTIKALKL